MFRKAVLSFSLLWVALSSPGICQSRSAPLSYLNLPLAFEANQGQTGAPVRFLSRGSGYSLYLTANGAVLQLPGEGQPLQMKLVAANPQSRIEGRETLPGKSNYFLGNDPARWVTNVPQ